MNKQKEPGAIEWTRVWGRPGYTWNVPGGCFHDCKWAMPDGVVAECYAKTVAERVAQAAYPQGFQHHYWHPERLNEPLKLAEPAGIFLDSMSDLMGHWVPEEQVHAVLEVCAKASQHVFFLLTKNAPRLLKFEFPSNVWVGVSMPPNSMFGRQLTQAQIIRMADRGLDVLSRVDARVRWMSFEPLSWDAALLFPGGGHIPLEWAVIGAASSGKTYYQPDPAHVSHLLTVLGWQNIPVFFKGNLRGNAAATPWRQEFPPEERHD